MLTEIEVKVSCSECFDYIKTNEEIILCEKCHEKELDDLICDAVKESYRHDNYWKDSEHDKERFISEEYKRIFNRDVKYGYESALFWVCDHRGDNGIRFYEDLIGEED
jgi:hypothetical protein